MKRCIGNPNVLNDGDTTIKIKYGEKEFLESVAKIATDDDIQFFNHILNNCKGDYIENIYIKELFETFAHNKISSEMKEAIKTKVKNFLLLHKRIVKIY